ncbi:MAG: uridine kinase [Subtercola sp.]|nr:uridine kinase [Subtercola sp.]
MVYPPTPRSEFLDALATEILHNYAKGRVLVGVDAVAGGRAFADDLAVALREAGHAVFRASLDDFQRPRAARMQRGANSAEAYYLDWFDYSVFLRVLVQPFRMGGSTGFITATFDAARDMPRSTHWVTGPQDAILLVDGPFLQRPELRGNANFIAYLETPESGLDAQVEEAAALYDKAVGPRMLADAIISVADAEHPQRLFADRC